jgi:hypothetical protein
MIVKTSWLLEFSVNLLGLHVGILILVHSVTNSEVGNPEFEICTTSGMKK